MELNDVIKYLDESGSYQGQILGKLLYQDYEEYYLIEGILGSAILSQRNIDLSINDKCVIDCEFVGNISDYFGKPIEWIPAFLAKRV